MTNMEENSEIQPIPVLPLIEELEKAGIADAIREHFVEQADGTDLFSVRLKQLGLEVICTCGAAPVQFEGTFGSHYLYFRARGNHWSCAIANTEEAAISGTNCLYYKYGEYGSGYEASWMPHVHALELIEECVVNFIKICGFKTPSPCGRLSFV